MTESRWEPILPHLEEFQQFLADHVAQLYIEVANCKQWSVEKYQEQCETSIFKKYGVYLIFAPDESLEYVGLAMNQFDTRIWTHDDRVDRCWTDIIPFAHEHYFLGPALEFFFNLPTSTA